jgi:Holliday junction resolvase RusA-like endonuclease
MRARVIIPDAVLMSKQHANHRSHGGNGHMMFTDRGYTNAKKALNFQARAALAKVGWMKPAEEKVALRISYRANRMNVDNVAGFILDALEGAAYLKDGQVDILSVQKRRKGDDWLGISVRVVRG